MTNAASYPTGQRERSVIKATSPDAHNLAVVGPIEALTGTMYVVCKGPYGYRRRIHDRARVDRLWADNLDHPMGARQ